MAIVVDYEILAVMERENRTDRCGPRRKGLGKTYPSNGKDDHGILSKGVGQRLSMSYLQADGRADGRGGPPSTLIMYM